MEVSEAVVLSKKDFNLTDLHDPFSLSKTIQDSYPGVAELARVQNSRKSRHG